MSSRKAKTFTDEERAAMKEHAQEMTAVVTGEERNAEISHRAANRHDYQKSSKRIIARTSGRKEHAGWRG